ncbi:MAG: restriction endonuclease subunit S [Candidatus Moranbacteria bacterium]|jgi:restriction endonuclease S subunit|nr:restriction endonuclease subunit S [Candidatus Moranbacteria bacterium]
MSKWEKIKIGNFLIKESTRLSDIDKQDLEVYGVSNVLGITKTSHKQSKDLSKYILIKPGFFAYNPYRINVGSVGLTPNGTSGLVSPAYVVFRTDKAKLLPELLLDFLKSNDGLFEIKRHARGTVRQALRFEDLCKIEMAIPPIEDQKEIIKRRTRTQLRHKGLKFEFKNQKVNLQKLRQSILQDAMNNAGRVALLEEICDFIKGESPIKKTDPGAYPLVVTGENRKTSDKFQFDTTAVCIPLVSSTGHGKKSLNYVHYQEGKFALGNILVALMPKDKKILNAKFLHQYLLINKDLVLVALMKGMANVTLPIKDLKKVKISLPDIEKQNKVEILMQKLDKLEAEISQNQKTADMLMQAVLREAFEK